MMGSFAKVLDGEVVTVIRAEPEYMENDFVDDSPGEWVQCSYNTRGGIHYTNKTGKPSSDQSKALRKNYPSAGWKYDGTGFYQPKIYDSWTLNNDTYEWEPPVEPPSDMLGFNYNWNEEDQTWDATTE